MSVIVKGGGGKPEEEKTVTAGTSVIEVSPSSGKVMKKVTVNPTPTESKSVTPTTSELTVTPSEGKHLSQVVVGAVEDVTPEVTAQTPVITQILEGLVGKAQGANATADKILEGYSAYVGQELIEGTLKKGLDLLEVMGYTKMAVDKFTFASEQAYNITLNHSLGEIPKAVLFLMGDPTAIQRYYVTATIAICNTASSSINAAVLIGTNTDSGITQKVTSTTVQNFASSSSYAIKAGVKYTLITMA